MGPKEENDLAAIQRGEDDEDLIVKKYQRGDGINLEALRDKKLKGQLRVREDLNKKSAKAAALIEKWLMPGGGGYLIAEGLEKTKRVLQEDLGEAVDILSRQKQYDIVLPEFGPYSLDFTSSGHYMALAGRKGHFVILDMKSMHIIRDFQVRETVRDVVFLHNELFFAAAQKKYPYIYNQDGIELHCLKEHGPVEKLQFLQNHFLLATINKSGQLRYQDVTTGEIVGNLRTGQGRSNVMEVNPFNGVVAVGHSRGSVSMWKPTTAAPLVKMLCHQGPVSAMAFHSNGHLMATAGMERKIKLWDLRKFQVLQTLHGHAQTLEFSQKGLLAGATGSCVEVWKVESGTSSYESYMSHTMAKGFQVGRVAFQPYEDVLCLGHSKGYTSILIPGSGEPNFDTWVANPFETSKQRREKEIHALLDKLPPEAIMLDPTKIGAVRPARKKEKPTKKEMEEEMEAAIAAAKDIKMKKKTKGRNKPSKRAKKKQEAVEKAKRAFLQHGVAEESSKKRKRISEETEVPISLQRFVKKKISG
ncbi:OLC1v1026204C1 [Oldenlandia corymbosa var. corymbosa]|uniref:OLC1v1026204C1 n=1 Tax=Oldenlandia corymbosa var. corymbosa TaxID=529605 RepID=A0AAV1C7B7_OLDCO|nr:OLC1v1026204C1 [Oldenlandia corymbosa var. corymbosa]